MVKRTEKIVASEINKLNENEATAVREYISQLLSKRISKSRDNPSSDDLIVSLSDAYENKRARQVVEWEKLGRQNLNQNQQRAA
ncbi:MAG TPA: hypothetical protein VGC76_19530 [Pyrinomonadaceae bacterium]|jgi:hypothetical protein